MRLVERAAALRAGSDVVVTGRSQVGAKFSEQASLTARLMLYGLLAVVLMAMDQRGQYVPRLRSYAGYLSEPVYHAIDWPVQAMRGVFGFFQSNQSLKRDNDKLRMQVLDQSGALLRLEALGRENQRLRLLLDGASSQAFDFQFAELVEVDLDPFSHKVIINGGQDQGVVSGQAVIDGNGVMGQVEDVQLHFSSVRLISDPNHALPVQINRTGLRTVAFGTGNTSQLNLPTVPREADVREGDLVVTSGLGDRFPSGYPVAVITAIDRQEGQTFAHVQAQPLAALDRGQEVLLIAPIELPPAPVAVPELELQPEVEFGPEPEQGLEPEISPEDTRDEAATVAPPGAPADGQDTPAEQSDATPPDREAEG